MIPEELYSKLQKAKENKKDLVLTEVEVTALMCTLYFYRKLFDKFNLTLGPTENNKTNDQFVG
jgi:hypothetical protein